MKIAFRILSIMMLSLQPALAGGVLGDIIRAVPGGKNLGDGLDDASRKLKDNVPVYKHIEEGGSGIVRKGFEELNGETAGPALSQWIQLSRNNVINSGVRPIPPQIYQGLVGYFSPQALQRVRYRSGWGNELALPAVSFEMGDAAAITLGTDVIMFRNEQDAQTDLALWAHEMTHTLQYERWGTLDFAKRYVKDHQGVEQEAINNASQYVSLRQQQSSGSGNAGVPGSGGISLGAFCFTQFGKFGPGPMAPVGSMCNITGTNGPIYGQIVP